MRNFKVSARFSCLLILFLLSQNNANDSTAFTVAPSPGSWSTEAPFNVTSVSLGGENKTVSRSVSGFDPMYGPVSGGTKLTISGKELTCSASLQVHLVSTAIRINCQNATVIKSGVVECVTLNFSQLLPLHVEVSCESQQSAGILWATSYPVQCFEYRLNPIIKGVYPGVSILAGGITQTVYGANLESVAHPIMTMTRSRSNDGAPQEQRPCDVITLSNSTIWKCRMPKVEGATNVSIHPDTVTIGLILDGFSKYLNLTTVQILEDPKIHQFNPDPMEFIANENNLITIGVDFPRMNFSSDDLSVKIGGFICEDIQLLELETITCRPPPLSSSVIRYGPSEKNTLQVTVVAGNVEKDVGRLHYVSRKSFHVIMIVMIAIIVFIILVSFIFGCLTLFASKIESSTKTLARRSKRKTPPFRTEETEFGTTDEGQEEPPQSDSVGRRKPRRNAKDSQDSKVVCLSMHDKENI